MLVDVTSYGHQIREHGVAHGTRHGRVGQRVEADVDDAVAADHVQPLEDRTAVIVVQVVRGDELGNLAGGQLLHQWADGAYDLVEIGLVVLECGHEAVEHRVVQVLRLQVAHQGDRITVPALER